MTLIAKENMSVEFDHEKKRIVFKQWGTMDKQSILDAYEFIFSKNDLESGYSALVDYRNIGEVSVSAQNIKEVLNYSSEYEKKITKSALLVGDNMGRYVLAKLYCALSTALLNGRAQRNAFKNLQEAEAWLDCDN